MELGNYPTIDFISGYPAINGKQVPTWDEVAGNRTWLGRVKCVGYSFAYLLCIPVSPLMALISSIVLTRFVDFADEEPTF